jgi:hypothetical protein
LTAYCGGYKEKPSYFEAAYKERKVDKEKTEGLILSS